MLKSFILSFRLRNTYKVNTILYAIKQFPIIGKLLPNSLYQNKGLKIFGNVISAIIEFFSIFLGKLIYIAAMVFGMVLLYSINHADGFVHIITFLTIIGAILNTYMFNPTKDKYYAMFLMRMDAKKYTLSNYGYAILKTIIGFMPFTLLFGRIAKVNLGICILIPFFIAALKIIASAYFLYDYKKKQNVINENKPVKFVWGITAVLLLLAYGLPYLGITMTQSIFVAIGLISILIGIFAIKYIVTFDKYREMYKVILTDSNINVATNKQQMVKETTLKQINIATDITSHKKGFAYSNDLFVKRHSKILSQSAKKIAAISLFVIVAILAITQMNPEIKSKANKFLMNSLPYFVFIMYFLNRGQIVTQAMFMNCDHSMLTYSFYRKPKAIFQLFKERIKSVVIINLIAAIVIAIGLPIILATTGGTDNPFNYLILFISIIAMSIFFSIHHLVLYYLLQPYNVNSETKSSTYTVASTLTYFMCYYMIRLQLPTTYFEIAIILFAAIYCIVSLALSYQLAPKTFRLRI